MALIFKWNIFPKMNVTWNIFAKFWIWNIEIKIPNITFINCSQQLSTKKKHPIQFTLSFNAFIIVKSVYNLFVFYDATKMFTQKYHSVFHDDKFEPYCIFKMGKFRWQIWSTNKIFQISPNFRKCYWRCELNHCFKYILIKNILADQQFKPFLFYWNVKCELLNGAAWILCWPPVILHENWFRWHNLRGFNANTIVNSLWKALLMIFIEKKHEIIHFHHLYSQLLNGGYLYIIHFAELKFQQ